MPDRKWVSLQEMTKAMVENFRRYEDTGTKPWDARIAIHDLAYQVGGIQKLDMQLSGERHPQGKTKADILAAMETELAEVVAESLFIAHELGLDILRGFECMLETDHKKIECRSRDRKGKRPSVGKSSPKKPRKKS